MSRWAGRRGPANTSGIFKRPWARVLRQGMRQPATYVFGVIPPALYLLSYWAWFASETAVNRYEVGQSIGERAVVAAAGCHPLAVALHLWAFHPISTLTNSRATHHRQGVKPWTWPMSLRPVLYAIDNNDARAAVRRPASRRCCWSGRRRCGSSAVPVLLYAAWRAVVRRGLAATRWYWWDIWPAGCPWLANIDRQMYFLRGAGASS